MDYHKTTKLLIKLVMHSYNQSINIKTLSNLKKDPNCSVLQSRNNMSIYCCEALQSASSTESKILKMV